MLIAGVDEAGRGPLAGDVVAAAVILDPSKPIRGLADSKKLSEKRREQLFAEIIDKARAYAVARSSPSEIDQINILNASLLAMHRAVDGLGLVPDEVLVDGNRLPKWTYNSRAIIGGDGSVEQISAASILAKVTRDRELLVLDQAYPGYGFAEHKGYPTKSHIEALARLGISPVHRLSYGPVKKLL
ncbi:MAG TPA: ribonuclease HII [Cellvibrionaceae bacterium]